MRPPASKSFGSFAAIALSVAALVGCVPPRLGLRPEGGQSAAQDPGAKPQAAPPAKGIESMSYPQKRPLDESRPVRIKSDRLRYYDKSKETEFIGHVVATQDTAILHADRMRSSDQGESAWASGHLQLLDPLRKVELLADSGDYARSLSEANLRGGVIMHSVDPYAVPVTVTGQSCWYQSVSRKARLEGGVTVWRGGLTATAETAFMDGGGDTIQLKGGVAAKLGVNTVTSDSAVMNGSKKSVTFQGGVQASLIPSQVQDRASHPEEP